MLPRHGLGKLRQFQIVKWSKRSHDQLCYVSLIMSYIRVYKTKFWIWYAFGKNNECFCFDSCNISFVSWLPTPGKFCFCSFVLHWNRLDVFVSSNSLANRWLNGWKHAGKHAPPEFLRLSRTEEHRRTCISGKIHKLIGVFRLTARASMPLTKLNAWVSTY